MTDPITSRFRNRAINFMFDFDGTLTKQDTLEAIFQIAKKVKGGPSPLPAPIPEVQAKDNPEIDLRYDSEADWDYVPQQVEDPQSFEPDLEWKLYNKLDDRWDAVKDAYKADYEDTLNKHLVDGSLPSDVVQERLLLWKLGFVERRSAVRVYNSGIFKWLRSEQIMDGAKEAIKTGRAQMREGCAELLQHLEYRLGKQNTELDMASIVSVNWSREFIAGCLMSVPPGRGYGADEQYKLKDHRHAQKAEISDRQAEGKNILDVAQENNVDLLVQFGPTLVSDLKLVTYRDAKVYAERYQLEPLGHAQQGRLSVYANDIPKRSESAPFHYDPPEFDIRTSGDKLSILNRLRKLGPYTLKPLPIIYAGDSWTDFECLLAADLGICIRDEPMSSSQAQLADAFKRLSIACPHINDAHSADEWGVVWVRNLNEIAAWLKAVDANERPA